MLYKQEQIQLIPMAEMHKDKSQKTRYSMKAEKKKYGLPGTPRNLEHVNRNW